MREIRCPYCKERFDFNALNKNEWEIELECLLVRCSLCMKSFKVLIDDLAEEPI